MGGGGRGGKETAAERVGMRGVVGMFDKEMAAVASSGAVVSGSWVIGARREVDMDELPTGAQSAVRAVGDKKETVGRSGNSGK